MKYRCRISDSQGKIKQIKKEAQSVAEMEESIKNEGLYLLSFEEEKNTRSLWGSQHSAVLELTQSLALMTQSGLSLKEAFDVTRGLFIKGKTAALVEQLDRRIQRGDSFSQAISSQGEHFTPLYKGMVEVGQRMGQLSIILEPLAQWLKERKELNDRIKGAMIYPIMVLSLVFIGVSALLIFFLPQLELLASAAGESSRQSLGKAMDSARLMVFFFLGIILFMPLLLFLDKLVSRKIPPYSLFKDRIKLKIPFLKRFIMTREMLSLSFALSLLTQCGVSLEDALSQAAGVLENRALKNQLLQVKEELLKGSPLSKLLQNASCFPPEFSRWTGLGEKIGSVDKVFHQLKQYYQQEMEKMLNRILTLAEPLVILLLGILLMTIILNVILPLLTMYGGV